MPENINVLPSEIGFGKVSDFGRGNIHDIWQVK